MTDQQPSTLRFPFVAAAEIAPESLPSASITAGVKELSLYGSYVDTPAPFNPKTCRGEDFQVRRILRSESNRHLLPFDTGNMARISRR